MILEINLKTRTLTKEYGFMYKILDLKIRTALPDSIIHKLLYM